MSSNESGNADLEQIREAVAEQLGGWATGVVHVEDGPIDLLPRWREPLPTNREILQSVAALQPWLQGPFPLPEGFVIEGPWRTDIRWHHLAPNLPDIRGRSVLDIGANAGYDAFRFHQLGASRVVACEPFEFIEQAHFLNSLYDTSIEFLNIGWQELDPGEFGTFDLVHCHGVLYHEPHPQALLERIRAMTSSEGTAVVGSILHNDPAQADSLKFLPRGYYNDPTWWFLPGRLAFRWMLESAGLVSQIELQPTDGAAGEFETIDQYHVCVCGPKRA
jgi:2-polyprenyl-3-methyl-5-hydroxy-6-metoxy-1,4-benzoquinol methylase